MRTHACIQNEIKTARSKEKEGGGGGRAALIDTQPPTLALLINFPACTLLLLGTFPQHPLLSQAAIAIAFTVHAGNRCTPCLLDLETRRAVRVLCSGYKYTAGLLLSS